MPKSKTVGLMASAPTNFDAWFNDHGYHAARRTANRLRCRADRDLLLKRLCDCRPLGRLITSLMIGGVPSHPERVY
jgi:hypothetical protein